MTASGEADAWMPDMGRIQHQIDTLTPTLPDDLTRTQIATLAVAMQIQGMGIALSVAAPILAGDQGAMAEAARRCHAVGEELLDGIA